MIRVVETEIMFKLHNSSFHNQSLSHFRSTYEDFCTHENTTNEVMDEVSWLLAGCELLHFFPPVSAVQLFLLSRATPMISMSHSTP